MARGLPHILDGGSRPAVEHYRSFLRKLLGEPARFESLQQDLAHHPGGGLLPVPNGSGADLELRRGRSSDRHRLSLNSAEDVRATVTDWLDEVRPEYFARDWRLEGVKKDNPGIRKT